VTRRVLRPLLAAVMLSLTVSAPAPAAAAVINGADVVAAARSMIGYRYGGADDKTPGWGHAPQPGPTKLVRDAKGKITAQNDLPAPVPGNKSDAAMDCSGLTRYAYHIAGVSIGQWGTNKQILNFKRISKSQALPGDLIFHGRTSGALDYTDPDGKRWDVYHVSIYAGNNTRVHSTTTKGVVEVSGEGVDVIGYYRIDMPGVTFKSDSSTGGGSGTTKSSSPRGVFEEASGLAGGKARVKGWAIDDDDPGKAVDIHVYIDSGPGGNGRNLGPAQVQRGDVGAHGFDATISDLSPGTHTLSVYAINAAGSGGNTHLGSRQVTVPSPLPYGTVDIATGRYGGEARIGGWAIDPAGAGYQAAIHVYVDGPANSGAPGRDFGAATISRADVGAANPGMGNNHGFDRVIGGLSAGRHTLYVYAVGAAGAVQLGTYQVTVGSAFAGSGGGTPGDTLWPGMALHGGQALYSANREYALVMQHDGNLVMYHLTKGVMWYTATFQAGSWVTQQGDGNFVLYNALNRPVWATMTHLHPNSRIVLQNDGNLVVYNQAGAYVWAQWIPGVRW
jgi:cell wall-associated NlpC family hydrolase